MTKEERKVYHKKYYQANKDKISKQNRQWYADNKDAYKDHRKAYRAANAVKLAKQAARNQKNRRQRWKDFIGANEMSCQTCGFDVSFAALTFHHRDPDKNK